MLCALPALAAAQDFPNRPITILCWSEAGSPVDYYARIMAKLLTRDLGQNVVVENRTGADGIIAVLKSPSSVECRDAKSGSFKGSISVNNAIDVACDGETIAVLLANSSVYRYNADNRSFQGSISVSGKPKGVQVSGGVIAVTTDRNILRYNARNGAFMGSSSL